MIEDHELDIWREQWGRVTGPSSEFQHKIQRRIKLQDRRFCLRFAVCLAIPSARLEAERIAAPFS